MNTTTLYDIPEGDFEIMNNQYYLRDLTETETLTFLESLSSVWEVTNNYWFPLNPVHRTDVIAFNADEFELKFGFQKLREIINNIQIFEIQEWRDLGRLIKPKFFEPKYDGDGEGFWFPKDMEWIIYCSHENSISFGGEQLIQSIKKNWKEWEQHIWG